MSDLNEKEQHCVRVALKYLRRRIGTWSSVADALHMAPDTIKKTMTGRYRVSASVALRVARLAGVSFDDLIEGRFMPHACPRCGYVPDFAEDEFTVAEDMPSAAPATPTPSAPKRLR